MTNQTNPRSSVVLVLACTAIAMGLLSGGAAIWLGVSDGNGNTEATTGQAASGTTPSTTTPPAAVTTALEAPITTAELTAEAPEPAPLPEPTTFAFPVKSSETRYDASHHDYPAADMFAPCDSPVVAVTDGRIEDVETVDTYDPSNPDGGTKSGLMVALVDSRGVRYYGSHMSSVSVGAGDVVAAGDPIGTVGETGNAVGTGCHLHFGLSPACLSGWEHRRGRVSPQPFLDAWRNGQAADPLDEVKAVPCA